MRPEELSRELRTESGGDLARRRGVIGLSLAAATSMGVIALYQTGILKHLPDPPLPFVNSEKVDASEEAYHLLQVPDGTLGLTSYAGTLTLAAMGGAGRAQVQPWIPLVLAAKVGFDTLFAAKLTVDQWTHHRAFCVYCLAAAACTFATVPLVIPELRVAVRSLRGIASGTSGVRDLAERARKLA